jgi:hypothetical protein
VAIEIPAFLKKDYGGLPGWAWGLAAIGGIGVGYYIYSKHKTALATASTPTSTSQDTTSPSASPGMGDYQALGSNAGNQTPTGATINIGVPATPSNWLTTLILTGSHPVNLYQTAGTPGGTPDAVIGTLAAGISVQATGPEVVGAWNVPNGSELWYPIVYNSQVGFVSAADVSNASSTISNQPIPVPPIASFPGPNQQPAQGSTFTANGILHYVATGNETLSAIAAKFKLQSWNSIYAIPQNQHAFNGGKPMNATDARKYIPKSGDIVVLPKNASV